MDQSQTQDILGFVLFQSFNSLHYQLKGGQSATNLSIIRSDRLFFIAFDFDLQAMDFGKASQAYFLLLQL